MTHLTHSALESLFLLLPLLLTAVFAYTAQPQDIDAADQTNNTPFTLELKSDQSQLIEIHVINATADIFWVFESVNFPGCGPAAGEVYICHGITIRLPVGSITNTVKPTVAAVVEWTGTNIPPGPIAFTLSISKGNVAFSRTYTLTVGQSMDVYLMLDKVGIMKLERAGHFNTTYANDYLLKAAIAGFMEKFSNPVFTKSTTRVGLDFFDSMSPASPFSTLAPVSTDAAHITGNYIIDRLFAPAEETALGRAINRAKAVLTQTAHLRNILVVTDGKQNIGPWISNNGRLVGDTPINPIDPVSTDVVRLHTIGIGSLSHTFLTTLNNIASANQGQCLLTSIPACKIEILPRPSHPDSPLYMPVSSIYTAFVQTFVNLIEHLQLVKHIESTLIKTDLKMADFTLNKNVDALVIELYLFFYNEVPSYTELIKSIQILKDDRDVTSLASLQHVDFRTDKFIIIHFSFNNDLTRADSLRLEGQWKVAAKPDSPIVGDNHHLVADYYLTALSIDHCLKYTCSQSLIKPIVGNTQRLTVKIAYLNQPIENAIVTATVLKLTGDISDALARYPLELWINSLNQDPAHSSLLKYQTVMHNTEFLINFSHQSDDVTLTYQGSGEYVGDYSNFDVAGIYQIVFHIQGGDDTTGHYERYEIQSMVVTPLIGKKQIYLKSAVPFSLQVLVHTSTGTRISAAADAFDVKGAGNQLTSVVDNQDGTYTLILSGKIDDNQAISIRMFDQEIFSGPCDFDGTPAPWSDF